MIPREQRRAKPDKLALIAVAPGRLDDGRRTLSGRSEDDFAIRHLVRSEMNFP